MNLLKMFLKDNISGRGIIELMGTFHFDKDSSKYPPWKLFQFTQLLCMNVWLPSPSMINFYHSDSLKKFNYHSDSLQKKNFVSG